jgi:protein required for attachment to host cells
MLFFRNEGDENQIDLRTEAHDQREDRKDSEIKTDAPGTAATRASSGGAETRRPAMGETDFHQQEEDRWIRDAAEEINRRALRNDFDALAIIAPPKALGVLRKELHKEAEKRLVYTINKAMSGRPVPDIEALLVNEAQVELPDV